MENKRFLQGMYRIGSPRKMSVYEKGFLLKNGHSLEHLMIRTIWCPIRTEASLSPRFVAFTDLGG